MRRWCWQNVRKLQGMNGLRRTWRLGLQSHKPCWSAFLALFVLRNENVCTLVWLQISSSEQTADALRTKSFSLLLDFLSLYLFVTTPVSVWWIMFSSFSISFSRSGSVPRNLLKICFRCHRTEKSCDAGGGVGSANCTCRALKSMALFECEVLRHMTQQVESTDKLATLEQNLTIAALSMVPRLAIFCDVTNEGGCFILRNVWWIY